jgi:hypothetical protein
MAGARDFQISANVVTAARYRPVSRGECLRKCCWAAAKPQRCLTSRQKSMAKDHTRSWRVSRELMQWRREHSAAILTALKNWIDDLLPGSAPQSANAPLRNSSSGGPGQSRKQPSIGPPRAHFGKLFTQRLDPPLTLKCRFYSSLSAFPSVSVIMRTSAGGVDAALA